jgi:glycolate oxidase FAD binding subunit
MNATTAFAPTTITQVQDAVRSTPHILAHGAATKPALATVDAATPLDLRGLSGILEYDPGEYTFTALAGTRLADLAAALTEHGQSLPFDPPLVDAGATLGGTLAAGLSGSGRYRYGGLRDFIVGVRVVDGTGRLVRGGGKVVKNAAGFDLPKLMVGSAGRLGVVVEAGFKVFPAPLAWSGLRADFTDLDAALDALRRLMAGPYDLELLDLIPMSAGVQLVVLLGGNAEALTSRIQRLRSVLGTGGLMEDDHITAYRREEREFTWAPTDASLIKVPLTQIKLPALDRALAAIGAHRRYTVGGNLAWIASQSADEALHELLRGQGLSGVYLRHAAGTDTPASPWIGRDTSSPFLDRIRTALDPERRFPA